MSDTPSQELSVALTNSNYHGMEDGVHRTLTPFILASQKQPTNQHNEAGQKQDAGEHVALIKLV
jgi:hypothetical protein